MSVEELRRRLAAVDREILERIGERQRLAEAIGRHKDGADRPLRDFAQEREVLSRARRAAEELGLAPELAERIMKALIGAALEVQERRRVERRAPGTGRRALVIGGAGRMGSWFVSFLASQGFEVTVADPAGGVSGHAHRADWREGVLDEDVIVVATDLRTTRRILAELAERRPPGLVFDVGSLKSPLRDALAALRAAGVRTTSLHPMFGPDTSMLSGRHVIFVDLGDPEATAEARELFASTMAECVEMDLDGHDRRIAFVLGLSHALNIAFFTALAQSGEGAEALERLSSTTFDEQLAVAGRVAAENPHLYFEIQSMNDFGGESLDALRRAVERVCSVVAEGDEEGFVRLMRRGRRYLGRRR